jgi:hypothetical protein
MTRIPPPLPSPVPVHSLGTAKRIERIGLMSSSLVASTYTVMFPRPDIASLEQSAGD